MRRVFALAPKTDMMRPVSSFIGGLIAAGLIFGAWFFISGTHRYQLLHGKLVAGVAGNTQDVIIRIDTATGRTWECVAEPGKLSWQDITDDPIRSPQK